MTALSLLPTPYVIQQPGPVFDTLGETGTGDDRAPVISIDGAETYPTEGRLDMLTVSVVGNPASPPSWFRVISAWADPTRAVLPMEAVYPNAQSVEERDEANTQLMKNSQQDAVAAALSSLGMTFTSTLAVANVVESGPAEGLLQADDLLIALNGAPVTDLAGLRSMVSAHGIASPVTVRVERDGTERDIEVTPTASGATGDPVLGIGVQERFDFPVDVTISLEDVGGPSAGMMFALAMIDLLTPGAMTGGEHIAGTGTITANGEVGPIGGVRQKLHAAREAGAEYFLAAADNCAETVGFTPEGLDVFRVTTLTEARTAVDAIAQGADLTDLPRCSAG